MKGDKHKTYIGDSVYAEFDSYGNVILTTENGYRPSNIIVLEPSVWGSLIDWHRAIELLPITQPTEER